MKARIKDINELPAVFEVDPDLMDILGVGRVKAYQLANSEGFPAIRLGHSIKIPKAAFIDWLKETATMQSAITERR